MLTLCPGIDCPHAGECERNVRFKRRYAYPHAGIYPVDRQPGRMVTEQSSEGGVLQRPETRWKCGEYVPREVVTS